MEDNGRKINLGDKITKVSKENYERESRRGRDPGIGVNWNSVRENGR